MNDILKTLLGAAAGAAITAIFTLGTQSHLQRQNLELQKQLEASKADFEKQRDQGLHTSRSQEMANEHLFQHHKDIHQQEVQLNHQYWLVSFKNSCTEKTWMALKYRALDGEWTTSGWWQAEPGETSATMAETTGRVVYYYASSAKYKWDGTRRGGNVSEEISKTKFEHLDADTFVGTVSEQVAFRRYDIDVVDWANPVIELRCDAGPAPRVQ